MHHPFTSPIDEDIERMLAGDIKKEGILGSLKAKAYYLATSQQYLKNRNAIIWGTGPNGVYIHDVLVEHDVNIEAFIEVNSRRIGGVKRGLPVLHFEVLNQYTDALIIGAVGARGARQEMRQALLQMGKREGHDFLFAA